MFMLIQEECHNLKDIETLNIYSSKIIIVQFPKIFILPHRRDWNLLREREFSKTKQFKMYEGCLAGISTGAGGGRGRDNKKNLPQSTMQKREGTGASFSY